MRHPIRLRRVARARDPTWLLRIEQGRSRRFALHGNQLAFLHIQFEMFLGKVYPHSH